MSEKGMSDTMKKSLARALIVDLLWLDGELLYDLVDPNQTMEADDIDDIIDLARNAKMEV